MYCYYYDRYIDKQNIVIILIIIHIYIYNIHSVFYPYNIPRVSFFLRHISPGTPKSQGAAGRKAKGGRGGRGTIAHQMAQNSTENLRSMGRWWKIPYDSHWKWSFSIAMLNYQRVNGKMKIPYEWRCFCWNFNYKWSIFHSETLWLCQNDNGKWPLK